MRRDLLDTHDPVGPRALGQARQQIDQPTEVVIPEIRPASADHHGWIVGDEIGPLPRESSQLSCVIVKVHAGLAPRLPALD